MPAAAAPVQAGVVLIRSRPLKATSRRILETSTRNTLTFANTMPSSTPLWREIFDAVEEPLGDLLTEATESEVFADVGMIAFRARDLVQREIERRTRHVLHFANIPTATDVRRLSAQVAALQRQVRRLEQGASAPPLARNGGSRAS